MLPEFYINKSAGFYMHLSTKRLNLRPLQAADWPFFLKLHQDASVMRYVHDMYTETEVMARFQHRLQPWFKEADHWLCLLIEDKNTGEPIGVTGMQAGWLPYRQAEIGFMLDPQYQGLGYGKESSLALLQFAFHNCGFHKMIATVTAGNDPSLMLLSKLGFVLEGRLRENFQLAGTWYDDIKLGLLASEFQTL
jgi:RimJ/RimL family protein N-acetyltransferase